MRAMRVRMLGAALTLFASLLPCAACAEDASPDPGEQAPRSIESADTTIEKRAPDAALAAIEPGISSETLAAAADRRPSRGELMDHLQLGRSAITGNQELPKVLYIVPWRKAEPGDLMGRPVNTLLDEVLAPIDREEFLRAVGYYEDLYGDDEE